MALNSKYNDEELLTGGLDKHLKLTNITHSRLIHRYTYISFVIISIL